jgi:predicted Zn finger-like uncharacterized protein
MLLTCPHCMTIFRVDADLILPDGQTVRCSICYHVWIASPLLPSANQLDVQSTDGVFAGSPVRSVSPLSVARDRLKNFRKPFLAAVLAATLASGVILNRGFITAYLPFLINGFDRIGLSIRPTLAQLKVAGLNASYVGDTMRVSGGLRNIGMWRTHSADLRVSVRGENGILMQEIVIRPDDDIIDSQAESGFFVQLVVEASPEAHVTVTPLANIVHR